MSKIKHDKDFICTYKPKSEMKVTCYFNIYQARNGSIQMVMGNGHTTLTLKQVNELGIVVSFLEDYDVKKFVSYYEQSSN